MADALSVDIVDSKGDKTGSVELPPEIFDVEPKISFTTSNNRRST